MELIDREKLKDEIAVLFERNAGLIDEWLANTVDDVIDELPTIDAVPVQDGILKARKGDYVTYRIDWLLDHLAQEISLLEGYRRGRKEDG